MYCKVEFRNFVCELVRKCCKASDLDRLKKLVQGLWPCVCVHRLENAARLIRALLLHALLLHALLACCNAALALAGSRNLTNGAFLSLALIPPRLLRRQIRGISPI